MAEHTDQLISCLTRCRLLVEALELEALMDREWERVSKLRGLRTAITWNLGQLTDG